MDGTFIIHSQVSWAELPEHCMIKCRHYSHGKLNIINNDVNLLYIGYINSHYIYMTIVSLFCTIYQELRKKRLFSTCNDLKQHVKLHN